MSPDDENQDSMRRRIEQNGGTDILAFFDYARFHRRLENALRVKGMKLFEDFCIEHALPYGLVMKAMREIRSDSNKLRVHWRTLDSLATALGRDLDWLITGRSGSSAFSIALAERVHGYISEFADFQLLSSDEEQRLHAFAELKLASMYVHDQEVAYRVGLPSNTKEVIYLYREMREFEG